MIFREIALKGAFVIELEPHGDERGQFVRTWCRKEFALHGIKEEFVQTALSVNPHRGTLRGLHWQDPPHEEAKLVRCSRGAIYDVIVDLRADSPTRGEWFGLTLTPLARLALFVPRGFAHGFQTIVDDTEVSYQLSAAYAGGAARGVRFDDPRLGIGWPVPVTCISDRDRALPFLDACTGEQRLRA